MAFRAQTPAMHVSSLHPSIPLIQTDTIQPLQYRLETYWCPCLVCYGCGAAIAVLLAACAEKSQNTAQRPQLLHSSGHTRSENNAERPQTMSKKQAEVFFCTCTVQDSPPPQRRSALRTIVIIVIILCTHAQQKYRNTDTKHTMQGHQTSGSCSQHIHQGAGAQHGATSGHHSRSRGGN